MSGLLIFMGRRARKRPPLKLGNSSGNGATLFCRTLCGRFLMLDMIGLLFLR